MNTSMSKLIISLDFELIWGIFDRVSPGQKEGYFARTKAVIPEILSLFREFHVQATWATVGMLMTESRADWDQLKPTILPEYQNKSLCPYRWIAQYGYDPLLHSADGLIEQIISCPGQELASHTFSHFYSQAEGAGLSAFDADLKMARQVAQQKYGQRLRTLVFPRNQYSEEHLKICLQNGFSTVRINPGDWFWKEPEKAGFWKKAFRTADAYLPLSHKTSFALSKTDISSGRPLQLPASRLLKPFNPSFSGLNELKLRRVMHEMSTAAQLGEGYHLWWHPHNFGMHPKENLAALRQILLHYQSLHDRYGMQSLNMAKLSDLLLHKP